MIHFKKSVKQGHLNHMLNIFEYIHLSKTIFYKTNRSFIVMEFYDSQMKEKTLSVSGYFIHTN